jgi:hypothetical protein
MRVMPKRILLKAADEAFAQFDEALSELAK